MNSRKRAVADFYGRFTPLILTLAIVLTGVGAYLASDLTLDSKLQRLLPQSAPSVQGLDRLETAYSRQIGRLAILIEGPEPAANVAAVDVLVEMLDDHELVAGVEATRPIEFFEERRLLYLDLDDVRGVAERVQKRIKWEKAQANPMFVGLGDDDPPEVDLSDIEDKYRSRFDQPRYLTDDDQRTFVIYVDPTFPNTEFAKTDELIENIRAYFNTDIAPDNPEMSVAFSGRHTKFFETQNAIQRDLALGTSLALVGILLFLIVYFRSWVYPVVIAVPLIMSTVWTFGWAQLVFGSLNMLTGFLGAVLMGLGIDYGIHIVSSFQEARGGRSPKEALIAALENAGRPSLYAGLTTLVALASLAYSSFQAFFEFGILSLGGLTLILLSYALVLPCLLLLIADSRFEPAPRMPANPNTTDPNTADPNTADQQRHQEVTSSQKTRWTRIAMFVLGASTVLAAVGMPGVNFEFDFRKLMPDDLPSFRAEDKVDEVVDMAQPPAVVLVDDKAHALAVKAELERRMANDPRADIVEAVFTVYDLVPDEQQEKLTIWRDLLDDLEGISKSRRKKNDKLQSLYDELHFIDQTGTLGVNDLPELFQQRFSRTDDPDKTVVLILPSHYIQNAHHAVKYVSVTAGLPGPGGQGTIDPISQEALLADILGHIKSDTIWLVLIAILGLVGVAWMAFRDLRRLALAIATVAVGVFVGTGLIGFFGVSFNFMNMVIWPIWLGLGVDAVFHLSSCIGRAPSNWSSFRHTAGAVFAAFATSMIGFGALMISGHRGLASLGHVAVIGLNSILIVSLAVHVFFLEPADEGSDENEEPDGSV
jgi:predicted RND superfamily exporter protein